MDEVTPERGHFRFRLLLETCDGELVKECIVPISRATDTVGIPITVQQLESERNQMEFKQGCLLLCTFVYTLASLRWVMPHLAPHLVANHEPEPEEREHG